MNISSLLVVYYLSVHLCHEDITVVIEMQPAPVELKQMKGRHLTLDKLIRGT